MGPRVNSQRLTIILPIHMPCWVHNTTKKVNKLALTGMIQIQVMGSTIEVSQSKGEVIKEAYK